jgi:hypothetical protein
LLLHPICLMVVHCICWLPFPPLGLPSSIGCWRGLNFLATWEASPWSGLVRVASSEIPMFTLWSATKGCTLTSMWGYPPPPPQFVRKKYLWPMAQNYLW